MRYPLILTATAALFATSALADTTQTVAYTYNQDVACDITSADITGVLPASGSKFDVVITCNTEFDLDFKDEDTNRVDTIVMESLEPIESTDQYADAFDVDVAYTEGLETADVDGPIAGEYKAQNATAVYTLTYSVPDNLVAGAYVGSGIVTITGIAPLVAGF